MTTPHCETEGQSIWIILVDYGSATLAYLQVLMGKDLGKIFPGNGVSPDTPIYM